jgi:hypothetical protein
VQVIANIRNFSLVNTPGKVQAQFYLGDPAAGVQLISDIYGKSDFETTGSVPAHGLKTIQFYWIRPLNSSAGRMYMVLDPNNSI